MDVVTLGFRRTLGTGGRRAPRTALVGLFLGAVAVGTDGFMIAGLLPSMAHSFHVGTGVAGQLVTVFAVTYALGAPVASAVLVRMGRRRLVVGSLVGLCAANAVAAVAPTLVWLFLARIAAALSACVFMPAAAVVAAGLVVAERRGRALGVVTTGLTVSIVTGVPLGALVGEVLGWRATFVGVAILSALVAVVMASRSMAWPEPVDSGPGVRARVAALRVPGVARVLTTTLLGILAGYLAYTYVTSLSRAAGVGRGALAVVLAGFGIGAVCGAVLSGTAADRYSWRQVVCVGAMLQVVALGALALMDLIGTGLGTGPVVLAFLLLGVGSFNYNAPQQYRLIELVPEEPVTVVSLNSSAIYAGIGLSGALGGIALREGPVVNCLAGLAAALMTILVAVLPVRSADLAGRVQSRSSDEGQGVRG